MPKDINKLKKLRHLMVYHYIFEIEYCKSWEWNTEVKKKDNNIGAMISLQTLYEVEVHYGGIDLIREIQKLRHLRHLNLLHIGREYGEALCALIDAMKHLEQLLLEAITEDETMDLHWVSSPPQHRVVFLKGRLEKLPDWVPKLEYLVELHLLYSRLVDDPLKPFKGLPNLSNLLISHGSFVGEILHFEEGGIKKLEKLRLRNLQALKSVLIDEGSLPLLHEFEFGLVPQLQEVPSGIRNLKQLRVLHILEMPHEFNQSIDPDVGHWVIQHVPIIRISQCTGPGYFDIETRTIRGASRS